MQRHERQGAVGCPEIDTYAETGSYHGRALSLGYSVLTWNSTFHRRSEFTCFIHSSSVPSSVTTELICTGTTCPAGKSGSGGRLISSKLVSSSSRSPSGRICPVGRRYGPPTRRTGIR